jgi:hypothetical protein
VRDDSGDEMVQAKNEKGAPVNWSVTAVQLKVFLALLCVLCGQELITAKIAKHTREFANGGFPDFIINVAESTKLRLETAHCRRF